MLTTFTNTSNNINEVELVYDNDRVIFSVLLSKFKNKYNNVGKLKDYDQYLVFWRTFDDFENIKIAALTSHLPLKDAGTAAIELFENIGK